jgi:hypothetical protein
MSATYPPCPECGASVAEAHTPTTDVSASVHGGNIEQKAASWSRLYPCGHEVEHDRWCQ